MLPAQVFLRRRNAEPLGPLAVAALEILYTAELINGDTPVSEDGVNFTPLNATPSLCQHLQEVRAQPASPDAPSPWTEDIILVVHPQTIALNEGSALRRIAVVATQKRSGTLSVHTAGGGARLTFHQGELAEVTADDPALSFATHLRAHTALPPAQLEVPGDASALAGALIASQAMPPHEVFAQLQAWALATLGAALRAPEADIGCAEAEIPKPALPLGLDRLALPVEAARAAWSEAELRAQLEPERHRPIIPAQVDGVRLEQLKLRPAELRVQRQLDGIRTLDDLLQGLSDPSRALPVLQVVRFLLSVGFAVLGEDNRAKAEAGELEALRGLLATWAEADSFAVLGIGQEATDPEVQAAYKALAKRHHPDTLASTASPEHQSLRREVFGRITEAFSQLRTAEARQRTAAALASGFKTEEEERAEVERILRAEADFKRGEALLRGRKYDDALAHFERAAQVATDDLELNVYLSYTRFMAAHRKRSGPQQAAQAAQAAQVALREVEAAIEAQPQLQSAQLFAAELCKAAGKPERAIQHFRALLELDPKNIEAMREVRLYNTRRNRGRR